MRPIISITLVSISFIIVCCGQKKIDAIAEGEKLMAVSREWSQTVANKDYEKVLNYWSDDAIIILPNQASVKGKAAIRNMVEADSKNPAFSISWEPLEAHISEDGSMGYLLEQNKISLNDSTTFYNKVVTVWRKSADGDWKNVVDISTPDATRTSN